jgi:molecular chaperone DnaJ
LENYYDTLGVSETATQEEIKKAFRTKSKELHPDRGGDEEQFKKVNEAYSTLSDDGKKQEYDMRRSNPFGGGGDPFDIFANMFGQRQAQRAPDRVIDLNVGAVDSFLGKKITINFSRKKNCEPCGGQGGQKQTCGTCQGTGRITQSMGNSFFQNIFQTPCGACQGRGFHFINVCNTCGGEGKQNEFQQVDINLPVGISDGQMIKGTGMGDFHNGVFGDIIFKINVLSQDGFEKSGADLIYTKMMSLDEFDREEINIPHPDGEITVKLPEVVDTTMPLRVKGKGYKNENGNFYVRLHVKHKRTTVS